MDGLGVFLLIWMAIALISPASVGRWLAAVRNAYDTARRSGASNG